MNQHVTGVAVASLLWSQDAVSGKDRFRPSPSPPNSRRSIPRKGQPAVVRIADTAVPPMVVCPW